MARLAATLLFVGLSTSTLTQSPPVFEVASVKPAPPPPAGAPMSSIPGRFPPGGRFEARNASLQMIIRRAYPEYSREPGQIVGPAWLSEARFDIDARAGTDVPERQIRLMLRQLLADRFGMTVHTETRELDAYELVVARRDGRLGPRMRLSRTDCTDADAAIARGEEPPRPPVPGGPVPCGYSTAYGNGEQRAYLGGRPAANLAIVLQNAIGRSVVDRTGLSGNYDIELSWAADATLQIRDDGRGLPSVFTAVQDQLGLRLQSGTVEVEVLVIDHVEQPTAD